MKNIIFSVIAIILFGLTSCLDDGAMNDMDKYKTIVYFPKSGLTKLTLYKTGQKTVYDLNVYKAGYDTKAKPVVNIRQLSQTELDVYNATNNTSYVLLPDFSYSIKSEMQIAFSEDELIRSLKIEFDTDTIASIGDNVILNSVLAFELSSSTDSVSQTKRVVFINPEVVLPIISFQTPGALVFNPTPNQEDPINFNSLLKLPVNSLWNFSVKLDVDLTAIGKYNTDNKSQYVALPSEAYVLPENVSFSKGDILKSIGLSVDLSKLKLGYYILPVKISSTDMSGLVVDSSYQFIILNYQPRKTTLSPIALSESMIVKHNFVTTWGQGLPGLFVDGDTKTYAHSSTSLKPDATYGIPFDILLSSEVTSAYLSYSTRDWAGNAPKRIAIFTSINGADWSRMLTINDGLPGSAAHSTVYESLVFSSDQPFKYVRFCVLESHNGVMDDISKSTAGGYAITEFRLWAK